VFFNQAFSGEPDWLIKFADKVLFHIWFAMQGDGKTHMANIIYWSKNITSSNLFVSFVAMPAKIKVAIISAVWKRPEVFDLFAIGIKRLQKIPSIKITVIISGSEGRTSRTMVQRHGFNYVEIANDPLGAKMNSAAIKAKEFKPDYVLCLGSDDIISPELMSVYERYMREKYDFIGVTDFFFYDLVTRQALYWAGYREAYRRGYTCGAGRLISRRLMEAWNWRPWEIKHSRGLDHSIQQKLNSIHHSSVTFSLLEESVFALDIKSSTNMTPFRMWDNACEIDPDVIKKHFPYVCVE